MEATMCSKDIASNAEMSGEVTGSPDREALPVVEEVEDIEVVMQILEGAEQYYGLDGVSEEQMRNLHDGLATVIELIRQGAQRMKIQTPASPEHPDVRRLLLDHDRWDQHHELLLMGDDGSRKVLYRSASVTNGDNHPHTTFHREDPDAEGRLTLRRATHKEVIDLMRKTAGKVLSRRITVDTSAEDA